MKNFFKGLGLGLAIFVFFVLGLITSKMYEILITKDKTIISRDIIASQKSQYDLYVAMPKFSASKYLSTKEEINDEEKAKISKLFSEVLEEARKTKICEGGSYTLQPNISYKDGLSIPSGYRFDSYFECRFNKDSFKEYENLLNNINKILENNDYITLNIPAIKSIVSKEQDEKISLSLYDEIYEIANKLKSDYSVKTNKICELIKLEYESDRYRPRRLGANYSAYDLPLDSDTEQSLKASATYECK